MMNFSSIRLLLVAVATLPVLALVAIPVPQAQAQASKAATPAKSAPVARAGFKEIQWDDLMPKDWDPLKHFKGKNLDAMSDSDPRVEALLAEMRAIWDNAPTNPAMENAAVKLPGYIVPLEESNGALKEFLLVPYFGACIHTPPPPANQIIHVIAAKPMKGFRAMDTVWISGTLKAGRGDTYMGVSGYRMGAANIERYVEPKQR